MSHESLAAWLLENYFAEERSGYGHVSAEDLAEALLAEFEITVTDEARVELALEQMERSDAERQIQSLIDSGLRLVADRDAALARVESLEAAIRQHMIDVMCCGECAAAQVIDKDTVDGRLWAALAAPKTCPTCGSTQPAAPHTGRWWRDDSGGLTDAHGRCPDPWHTERNQL